mmetsp:Transcript_64047/g.202638  ORF Transcript_64047/g.202638 Transcript_64047/m.202638 type:complete len:82 (-) Transcript_64047:223-468(-)
MSVLPVVEAVAEKGALQAAKASKKLVKGTDEGAEEEFNTVLDNVKKARVNLTNLGKAFLEGVESGEEEANQERRERWSKNK